MTTRPTIELENASREQLYALAQEHDVPGRGRMSKTEMQAALVEAVRDRPVARVDVADRYDAFAELAAARARGEVVALPRTLTGDDRRLHVRQTLREDHEHRIAGEDVEAQRKFDKLAGSRYSFFRGTCLLFYRDLAGEDAWMPTVLALGDVHPENFGVMPSVDDVPIFGVNDFDEAFYAPFTWDLKRGATGFLVAADEEGGLGRSKRRDVAEAFVRGYLESMRHWAQGGSERDRQTRLDNAPKLIGKLIKGAMRPRSEWLADKYLDEYGAGFRADDEHVPVSHRREEFQQLVDTYVRENEIEVPDRAAGMRVKDVCERKRQGTASLGLTRYYLLIEGPRGDGSDDILLEAKQARRSALSGLVPPSDYEQDGRAERIAHAQRVHLVRGDRFYGFAELDGSSFLIRERAPYRDDVDLDDLSDKQWRKYAQVCGRSLAHAHSLSDDSGRIDYDVEPAIVEAAGNEELFVDDMVRFAEAAAERLERDHEHFRADHALGAFRRVDLAFR